MSNRLYISMAAVLLGTAAMQAQGVVPPYRNEFASSLGDMKVVNAEEESPAFIFSSWGGYSYGGGVTYTGAATYAADEYLVTPAMEVTEGSIYTISYMCKNGASGTPYKVTVVTGDSEDNLTQVVGTSEIAYGYSFDTYQCDYEAKATGTVWFALHLEREAGTGTIAFDNFAVSAGFSGKAPAAVGSLTATPRVEDDTFVVALEGKAPALTHAGAALEGNVTVTATRSDGETVGTLEGVVPGEAFLITDASPLGSYATYTVTASNEYGTSVEATATSNPTFGTPEAVAGLAVTQSKDTLTLTWNAVTTSASGASAIFIPSQVTYKVVRNTSAGKVTVAENLADTTFSEVCEAPAEGQEAVSYTVTAVYNNRAGAAATTESMLVGNPYEGEYAESFANYSYTTKTWTVQAGSSNVWMTTSSVYSPSCSPQDGDNGMLRSQNTGAQSVWIASPLINVKGLKNPRLDFYVYQDPSSTYTNAIQPILRTAAGDISLGDDIAVNGGERGWNRFSYYIPAQVREGDFQIVFNALPGGYTSVCVDNITIKDILDHNLVLEGMDAPESVKVGETFTLGALLANKGSMVASGYSVKLLLDGEELGAMTGEDISSEESKSLATEFRATPAHAGKTLTFETQLVYEANESTEPATLSRTVVVETNDYPTPAGLVAAQADEAVTLNWAQPEVPTESTQEEVNEDFESWTSYTAQGEKGWTFVNANGANANGIDGNHASAPEAVMIADNVKGYVAKSGTKVLAISKPYSYRDTPDDWAISPEVIGGQTISFSAVSYNRYAYLAGSDAFTVCYSTGSTDPKDFKPVDGQTIIKSLSWVDYTVTLPAEATRFAIHATAINNDGLFFDDFHFVQGSKPVALQGYNVYRDGQLIGASTTNSYLDPDVEDGHEYAYRVSAVYDRGESLWSDEAVVTVATGIGDLASQTAVRAANGCIILASATQAQVSIVNAAGMLVYSGVPAASGVSVPVPAGIYLVQVGGVVYKVSVR